MKRAKTRIQIFRCEGPGKRHRKSISLDVDTDEVVRRIEREFYREIAEGTGNGHRNARFRGRIGS